MQNYRFKISLCATAAFLTFTFPAAAEKFSKQDSFEMGKTDKLTAVCEGNYSSIFSERLNKAKAAHPKEYKAGYNSVKVCPTEAEPETSASVTTSNNKQKPSPKKIQSAAKRYIENECKSAPQLCKSKRKGALSKSQMIAILSKADQEDQFPEYIEGFFCKNTGECEAGD
ncbi:hypothetical protein [Brucella tritici]|uniref:hypothetical protein n=1 Tax=Brucella tritici TaxID=94626 RepID=UPI002001710E|nr:hypothetical protein [Brucella tritici]